MFCSIKIDMEFSLTRHDIHFSSVANDPVSNLVAAGIYITDDAHQAGAVGCSGDTVPVGDILVATCLADTGFDDLIARAGVRNAVEDSGGLRRGALERGGEDLV